MLAKFYRALPPGGLWFLASAALFVLGSLFVPGSSDSRLSVLGLVGALVAVLIVLLFSGRGPQQRP